MRNHCNTLINGNEHFTFRPSNPLYITAIGGNKSSSSQKVRNRFFELPVEIRNLIFSFDNTPREQFKGQVLRLPLYIPPPKLYFLTEEVNGVRKMTEVLFTHNRNPTLMDVEESNEEDDLSNRSGFTYYEDDVLPEDTNYDFYRSILYGRFRKNAKTPFCEYISCGLKTSLYNCKYEYPQPYELQSVYYRAVTKSGVKSYIYKYNDTFHYFIRCEDIDLASFIKELYHYKKEPDGADFECRYYKEWKDVNSDVISRPCNQSLDQLVDITFKGKQYKKVMITGYAIGNYHDIILYEDINTQNGKKEVCIQLDIDRESLEDDMMIGVFMLTLPVLVDRRIRQIFKKSVHQIIQVMKHYRLKIEEKRLAKIQIEETKNKLECIWENIRKDIEWKSKQGVYSLGIDKRRNKGNPK